MTERFDAIILGTGNAGMVAAGALRAAAGADSMADLGRRGLIGGRSADNDREN